MDTLGLILALATLITLAFRGVNIIIAALAASTIVAVTNELTLTATFTEYFPFGPLGAFTFMGRFFLLFLTGATFGTLMANSLAVTSIAEALSKTLGEQRTLLVIVLAAALMTYGGVVAFVVIFVIYPLGLQLIERARLPRRLLLASMSLGAGTFTMTALPGTPSIHNVIPSVALGTDLYAGAALGLLAAAIMLGLGSWYLLREQRKLSNWQPPADHYTLDNVEKTDRKLPDWRLSLVPMAVVLITILAPKLIAGHPSYYSQGSFLAAIVDLSHSEPILWPSLALALGSIVIFAAFPAIRGDYMANVGRGANNSIMPIVNTSVVIGFGGVVTQTTGFQEFANLMVNLDLPPKVSAALSVNVLSGIVGSASGGLQIFMQSLAERYLALGIPPDVLHRIATVASGCIDSLPHSGGVVASLSIMRVTHKEGYKDLAMVTVVIPIIATAVMIGASTIMSS